MALGFACTMYVQISPLNPGCDPHVLQFALMVKFEGIDDPKKCLILS